MKKTVKKRKVKKRSVFVLFIIIGFIVFTVCYVLNFHITNIFIKGNTIYTDQEIIDMAGLSNYPRTLNNNEFVIKKRLEKDKLIKSVKIKKKNFFREVYIIIKENKPLFIFNNKTVLQDGLQIDDQYDLPILINEINNQDVYKEFLKQLLEIDSNVYERISEIKYDPNDKDNERFLMYMNDGNNVYITLRKIERINNYIEIISAFEGKKGILYLDSGEYFEVFGG